MEKEKTISDILFEIDKRIKEYKKDFEDQIEEGFEKYEDVIEESINSALICELENLKNWICEY